MIATKSLERAGMEMNLVLALRRTMESGMKMAPGSTSIQFVGLAATLFLAGLIGTIHEQLFHDVLSGILHAATIDVGFAQGDARSAPCPEAETR